MTPTDLVAIITAIGGVAVSIITAWRCQKQKADLADRVYLLESKKEVKQDEVHA